MPPLRPSVGCAGQYTARRGTSAKDPQGRSDTASAFPGADTTTRRAADACCCASATALRSAAYAGTTLDRTLAVTVGLRIGLGNWFRHRGSRDLFRRLGVTVDRTQRRLFAPRRCQSVSTHDSVRRGACRRLLFPWLPRTPRRSPWQVGMARMCAVRLRPITHKGICSLASTQRYRGAVPIR